MTDEELQSLKAQVNMAALDYHVASLKLSVAIMKLGWYTTGFNDHLKMSQEVAEMLKTL